MTTLALDTSTPAPALGLVRSGTAIHRLDMDPVEGGRRVLEGIHALLTDAGVALAEIDRIVVGVGPGNFTGLRIGIATALALGQAGGAEVVGAGSLHALALGMFEDLDGAVMAAASDARRGEVFAGAFRRDADALEEVVPVGAYRPEAFVAAVASASGGDRAWLAGTGALAYPDAADGAGLRVPEGGHPAHRIRAANLVRLVEGGAAVPARPSYHRLPDAEVNRLARAAAQAR